MHIHSLLLQGFRKFPKETLTFISPVTIIVGGNATGKTTILEALFLLATGKSFRAERDVEGVAFEKEVARIKGVVAHPSDKEVQDRTELELILTTGLVMGTKTPIKQYMINGVGKRMMDFTGRLKVVLFWPEDLELVTYSPSLRRRYLDSVLIQADREYHRTLGSYERGLRQRNRLLEAIREGVAHPHQLLFWDQMLIKQGEYISKKRGEFIDFVNTYPITLPGRQAGNIQYPINQYQLIYDASFISRDRLDKYREAEVAAGVTLVGPHRDDIEFRIKNSQHSLARGEQGSRIKNNEDRNLAAYGSRGEQRLGVLWLKMGELAYLEKMTGEKPILLLDDILSELDHEHRTVIFSIINNQQTVMTTTDEHFLPSALTARAGFIRLK
jgi:DNA replication and repair protein RecF